NDAVGLIAGELRAVNGRQDRVFIRNVDAAKAARDTDGWPVARTLEDRDLGLGVPLIDDAGKRHVAEPSAAFCGALLKPAPILIGVPVWQSHQVSARRRRPRGGSADRADEQPRAGRAGPSARQTIGRLGARPACLA